ncbi:MAG: glycosyltransferase [Candidatus Devosia phytovorans]|uniref:Glycosyltransferase n=1 Tax=Candidatus Devosia phytovorans TaxID=3121372 RepID=A0AAJ5VS38_9HYPH|nr:glycosyltransferase [Devosia sp.]WEK03791.1 MAG: glycosyltransferase [Devosia sp.]
MRVLVTTPTFPPHNSGLGNAALQQALGLQRRGVDVVVATGGDRRAKETIEGIAVERFAVSGAESLLHPIRGDVTGYLAFLEGSAFDVLLLNAWQNWATDLAMRIAPQISGRKFLYSHGLSTNVFFPAQPVRSTLRFLAWRRYWWELARKSSLLDGVIALAETGTDSRFDDVKVVRRSGTPVHIIANSASNGLQDRQLPHKSERRQIIAVGSYTWLKGFDFVLRAYAASAARGRYPLVLYGQHHTRFTTKLRHLARRLDISDADLVFNEGFSGQQLAAEYSRAVLVISGSRTECQPLVLIDAMATGTPFVARPTGCIADMPGGVVASSPSEAARQIDRILADDSVWSGYSAMSIDAAATTYDAERNADLLLHLLRAPPSGPGKPA